MCLGPNISMQILEPSLFTPSIKIAPRTSLSSNIRSQGILPTSSFWYGCISQLKYLYLIILQKSDKMNCYSMSLHCLWRVTFLGPEDMILNNTKFLASWCLHYLIRWPSHLTLDTQMEDIVGRHPTLHPGLCSTNSYGPGVLEENPSWNPS